MPARLFVVHGSHPCATVEKALELKDVPYRVFEWTPPAHAIGQRVLFGVRTVPAIRFEDGEKVAGSRAILARLDERRPEPPLYGADPDERARVLEAERWGDEVFQPIARRILWPSFQRDPAAMHSFQQGSRLPALPLPVIKALAPGVIWAERHLNDATDDAMRADLHALPSHLDRIDGWIADGVLDGERLNAADLQIAGTLNLLMAIDDVRPLIEQRPAGTLARRVFAPLPGRVPAGTIPADWLPAGGRRVGQPAGG
jgi:glutathione S-transferase